MMENPIQMDDLGVPLFTETLILVFWNHIPNVQLLALHMSLVDAQSLLDNSINFRMHIAYLQPSYEQLKKWVANTFTYMTTSHISIQSLSIFFW